MQYRRAKTKGGTYFFTVVTHNRRQLLCVDDNVSHMREAFRYVMEDHLFEIDAIVLLPDHLHCIWTLPDDDHDFSTRWRLIKSYFTRHCDPECRGSRSASRQKKQEQAVWQRRFWEHQIRDERDFTQHVEYIHYNPVKHGLAKAPRDWPYSRHHHDVRWGIYAESWGADKEIVFADGIGHE